MPGLLLPAGDGNPLILDVTTRRARDPAATHRADAGHRGPAAADVRRPALRAQVGGLVVPCCSPPVTVYCCSPAAASPSGRISSRHPPGRRRAHPAGHGSRRRAVGVAGGQTAHRFRRASATGRRRPPPTRGCGRHSSPFRRLRHPRQQRRPRPATTTAAGTTQAAGEAARRRTGPAARPPADCRHRAGHGVDDELAATRHRRTRRQARRHPVPARPPILLGQGPRPDHAPTLRLNLPS